ncbi:hypothetical protein Q5O24_09530 [Eubacteriaceae bacterium ES3]|nr:hypothetical protein Q5O24_09530 [Eubacteriaceae bacterium ES3]
MKTKNVFTLGIICSVLFTLIIAWFGTGLGAFRETLLPDQGAAWYYWKLPEISLWATVTMWLCYGIHQILVWFFIYKLQHEKHNLQKDTIGKYNVALLIANGVFIILHVFQTQFFYDGLAQFVPVASSQYSVIVMLVFMLILLNGRRGLFFGKKVPLSAIAVSGIAKTHGYFIAWAAIYTFWFHPMENTWGHLLGFFYMFLLMLQMSFAYTKIHINIKWVTILEVFVTLHGTVIALQAGQTLWSMFLFGFAMMFIVTQMYGVVRWKSLRIGFTLAYLAVAIIVYSGILGTGQQISQIHQIFWIPVILYGLVFVIVGSYHIAMKVFLKKQKATKQGAYSHE